MTTKLARIKSALRESIEIASKATEGPWTVNQLTQMFFNGKSSSPPIAIQRCQIEGGQTFAEPFRGWCSYADAKFLAHARTMTPLACKALLTAIEGLEELAETVDVEAPDEVLRAYDQDTEIARKSLSSITFEWPDV